MVGLINFDLFFAFLISFALSWFNYDNTIAIRCIYSISLDFWEGVMAQAYSKLLKNVELSEFPSNYWDVKLPMRANIRPKKLKSSVS